MDHVLADKLDVFVMVYLDDILVFSKKEHNHAEHLHWVLTKLREHKLKAKRKKSAFGLAELQYLGHIVQKLNHIYGSVKNRRNYQVACTHYSQRTADVPLSMQLLCQVCKTFCDNSCTTTQPVMERITIEMGNRRRSCI